MDYSYPQGNEHGVYMSCTPATVLKGSGNGGLEHMKQCFLLSCHLLSTIPLLLKRLYSQYVF